METNLCEFSFGMFVLCQMSFQLTGIGTVVPQDIGTSHATLRLQRMTVALALQDPVQTNGKV